MAEADDFTAKARGAVSNDRWARGGDGIEEHERFGA